MADLPPIAKTVDPKLTMTNAEQALRLEEAFDKTFGPLSSDDTKPEPEQRPESKPTPAADSDHEKHPPEAVETGAESAAQDLEAPPVEAAPEPELPPTHPDDEADEEVDKFQLHPETRPEQLNQFREMRGKWKTDRKKVRELTEQIQKSQVPRSVSDPTVQKELDDLRTFKKRHEIFDDTTYQVQFENPVHQVYDDIINDVKRLSGDPEAAASWEKDMRSAGPDRVGKEYWNDGLLDQIGNPLDKDRLVRKISTLLELQDKRNAFRTQMAEQPDAYAKFQHETAARYWDEFAKEAEDEMKKVTPALGEWSVPKDLALAKNATEKSAFEAHNAQYQKYEQMFREYISDAATQGPRGMARISAMAVYGEKRRQDLEVATKKIAKLEAELAKHKEELNKIAGARSRVSQPSTAGQNGQPQSQVKRKAGESVDQAFKNFFGS